MNTYFIIFKDTTSIIVKGYNIIDAITRAIDNDPNQQYQSVVSCEIIQEILELKEAKEIFDALCGIIEIGKRNLTNPKYNPYFIEAEQIIKKYRSRIYEITN